MEMNASSVAYPWTTILKDYVRIGQPTMGVMLMITALVGYTMAVTIVQPQEMLLLGICSLMAALGAKMLNHCAEAPLDAKMKRTRERPLASGRISLTYARWLAWTLVIGGTLPMFFWLHPVTGLLSALTVVVYVYIYTPMKLRSTLNTVVGAFPGAFPMLGGWFAGGGEFDQIGLGLTAIMFLWQFPHFLAIAWLCQEDYKAAGFKMLPNIDPTGRMTGQQILLYAVALFIVGILPTTLFAVCGPWYGGTATTLGLIGVYFAYGFYKNPERRTALNILKFAYLHLTLLFIMMLVDKL